MSDAAPFSALEQVIGVTFKNKDHLRQALIHRSAARESAAYGNNERLEFLGDAVLELVATEHLYRVSPKDEGELTSWRSALVQGDHLAEIADSIELGKYLSMSRGEEASGGRTKVNTLANALEALIGAIYLDKGYEVSKRFCEEHILVHLQKILRQGKHRDDKSLFQEIVQDRFNVTPHYELVEELGPDHDKVFTCGVFIKDEKIAEGKGSSKQRAEQAAARAALKAKGWR
jgi:ribonuclease-3